MPALLVICFTLSGATSLILQVVWVRRLIGVFGASSLAIATVLATFMTGLALGSAIGGRLADRLESRRGSKRTQRLLRSPLFYYGLAEIVVGIAALAILPLIDSYHGANAWLWQRLGDYPWLLASARFVLTATVLLIPTTAMGATLPLLSRFITRGRDDLGALGRRLALLYAANTAGALVGAASAGFWLIALFGVHASNTMAALFAIGVGVAIILVSLRAPRKSSIEELARDIEEPQKAGSEAPLSPAMLRQRRHVLWLYALSGAVAMQLEVLWSRTLAIINGSSTYSFTLVLCTFLVGISLGSAAAGRLWGRTREPMKVLAWLFWIAALGILFTHALTDELPAMFLSLVEGTSLGVDTVLRVHLFLTALVIVPTALALGAVMPVAIRAYVGTLDAVGRDVGRAYAANTLGAIVGSLAGGFLILPGLGLELGIRASALIMVALALFAGWTAGSRRLIPAICVVVAAIAVLSPSWNRSDLTVGVFRTHLARDYIRDGGIFQREVVFYRDGISTTVSVEQFGGGWVLRNNGKVEASNRADMPTQILVGLMPVLLHGGEEQSVFLVGYGSGVTVGSIGISPQVADVDVVELEPAVYEAADRFFGSFNNHPESNPKINRLQGDGRNVLLASGRKYDVIVSEPSNPWIAGVATLFTQEFYALAKAHLKEDGVFCQWAQLYELGPRNVKMIYRTFSEAFRYVYAFTPGDETTDTILLGSDRPLELSVAKLQKRIDDSEVLRAELVRGEIARAEDIVASLLLGPREVASFTAGAAVNTDDNALLEFAAPRDLLDSASGNYFARLVRGDTWPYGFLDDVVSDVGGAPGELRIARALMTYGRLRQAKSWIERSQRGGADVAAVERVLMLAEPRDFLDPEMPITEAGPALPAPGGELFLRRGEEGVAILREGYKLFAEGKWSAGWLTLKKLPPRAQSLQAKDLDLLLAYFAFKSLELDKARKLLEPLAADPRYVLRRPSVLYYLGRSHFGLGHFRDAVERLEEFAQRWPELAEMVANARL